jgi:hypothetical protein
MILTPWSWSIAYRRFNQGVLIRYGHSKTVGAGTLVRLAANVSILATGYLNGSIPGIIVAASAVSAGVISEAVFARLAVAPVLRRELRFAPAANPPVRLRSFLAFYIPLAMTSLLTLLTNPIGSAAISRMPEALASLAVWPVVSGLVFLFRTLGVAFNEVVVALLDAKNAVVSLRRFAWLLAFSSTLILFLVAATPFSTIWFEQVSALQPHLAKIAGTAIWIALPLPALSVFQSWFQGAILNHGRTRGITEAVVVFIIFTGAVLAAGIVSGEVTGLYVGLAALVAGTTAQTIWLWLRSRPAVQNAINRDILQNTTAREGIKELL